MSDSIKYTCTICNAPAEVNDGQITRTCEHDGGGIAASLKATVYGQGSLNRERDGVHIN